MTEKAITTYDAEQDKMISLTRKQIHLAGVLHQQMTFGVFITAVALKRMKDEKLYLALNCQSFNEYLLTMSPIGRVQAYAYVKIAERFQQFLPEIGQEGVREGVRDVQSTEHIEDLGIQKLYELTRLDEVDFNEVIDGKGNFSLEEVKEMTVREFREEITKMKKAKDKYLSKSAQLDEENKLLFQENETLKKQVEEADKKIKILKDLETTLGAKATKLAEKRELLERSREALALCERYLFQTGINCDDPADLRKDLSDYIHRIGFTIDNCQREFGEVLLNL
jgi:hypothetical protein